MADRRVKLILEAQVDQFNSNLRKASDEADGLGKKLRTAINQPEMQQLGRHLTVFGTATVGALGLATKAAMDWESSWTDVMRRTEGTPQQLADLEDSLRGVARELPSTHQEVAAVAAAAAQLGVGIDDVEQFTRVMIDMGVATNMTAEQAATSMARFANIMGTPIPQMDQLGSSIVDLGNNAATTESEIMDMGLRLAGAARQAGLSEGEVMGLATAMSSLGLEAQAGGTALSRTMITIGLEVDRNGDKLEEFARVAGMSSEDFSKAWGDDAAAALLTFIEGLSQSEARGESMNGVLADLGITAIRESDALRRLASNVELTSETIERGNRAWEENTAMVTEAGYVYETAESRIIAAWAMIYDAAIDVGAVLVPMMASLAEGAGNLAQAFAQIPAPAQAALTILAGLIGVGSLAAGSFILLAPGIAQSAAALSAIGITGERARRGVAGVARTAGRAAPAILALAVASEAFRVGVRNNAEAEKLAEAISRIGTEAESAQRRLEELSSGSGSLGFQVKDLGEAFRAVDLTTMNEGLDRALNWIPGLTTEAEAAREVFRGWDQALADLAQGGNLDAAAAGMMVLAEEAEASGKSIVNHAHNAMPELSDALYSAGTNMDEFLAALGLQNGYMDEASGKWVDGSITLEELAARMSESEQEALAAALGVEELDGAMEGAAGGSSELQTALEEVGLAADGTVESMKDFLDVLFRAGILTMDAREATARFHESIRSADSALQEIIDSQGAMGNMLNQNRTDFDLTTEAGQRANRAFQDIAKSGFDAAGAMAENGASQDEVQRKLRRTYDELVTAARGFGISEEAAKDLAREVLGIEDHVSIETWMSTEAENTAKRLKSALDANDGRHTRSSHTHTITERTLRVAANTGSSANRPAGFATGGAVRGPGGPTSDDIPAWLSNGEHVLTAKEVALLGGQEGVYQFRRQLTGQTPQRPSGSDMVPAYATGGAVTRAASAPAQPQTLVGTLYMEDGALLGQVRMAMTDEGVVRAASEGLAGQANRDMRGTGGRRR